MSEQQNPLGAIITKAMQDETFKQQLIADPAAVLTAEGVAIPEGVTVKVVADTASVRHIVLPAVGRVELSENELERVTAGGGGSASLCGNIWD